MSNVSIPPKTGRRSKMQDVPEFIRWYESGMSYGEMVEQYATKYNLEVTTSMFSMWRHRLGLVPRQPARDTTLIPWDVKPEHEWGTLMRLLQAEARLRIGADTSSTVEMRLAELKAYLRDNGLVVHYEPDTKEGFWLVPARPGIDTDLIRVPGLESE